MGKLSSARTLLTFAVASLCTVALAQAPEYRTAWADAFHTGYLSSSALTTTVNNLRAGNQNVFVPEIYVNKSSQLIYWNPTASEYPDLGGTGTIVSNGLPIQCDLNSDPETNSGGTFDPLAESIRQCHDTSGGKARLDVWAWMVSFRSAGAVPAAHPEWITVNSTGSAQTDFDPGHPGAAQQLLNNCMDIVKHYDVDGLNFDYIRFTDGANGLNPVSVARYNAIKGKTGTPSTSDATFKQWRRDQVTNIVRKIYLNVIAVKPNVKISVDTITWTPSPTRPVAGDPNPLQTWKNSFQSNSGAYTGVYQDWRGWMEEGIIDIALLMNYFSECAHKVDYDKWSDFAKDNQFGRQCIIGPGGYLNALPDALAQMARTRDASSTMGKYGAGQNNYSYAVPYAASCGGAEQSDPAGWRDAIRGGIYSQPATVPALPRLTNGKGHIKGTVVSSLVASPGWVDGGTVSLSANANGSSPLRTMPTDGTGFYGFVDVTPGSYYIKVHAKNNDDQIKPVTVIAATVSTVDFTLSGPLAPAQLAFSVQPAGASTGVAFSSQPVVVAKDSAGNVATTFNGPVSLSIASGTGAPGAALLGTVIRPAANGVATFSGLSINRAGAGYVLRASATGLAYSDSDPFSVAVVPTRLAFSAYPAGAVVGQPLGPRPVVTVTDDLGNAATAFNGPVTLSIKEGTGYPGAALSGTVTMNAVGGSAAFDGLSIDKVGFGYRLHAVSGSLTPADSFAFDIRTSAVKLAFNTQPGGAKAGSPFARQPVVVAQNAAGQTATDFEGPVYVGIKDGTGSITAWLDGNTSLNMVKGIAAFTDLSIDTPASGYVLTVTAAPLPIAESVAFDVVSDGPYSIADAIRAAGIAGGFAVATDGDSVRLDVDGAGGIDLLDAARITRKVAGLEANP